MPNMLAAEAAAADGQKLLSPVAPAMLKPGWVHEVEDKGDPDPAV